MSSGLAFWCTIGLLLVLALALAGKDLLGWAAALFALVVVAVALWVAAFCGLFRKHRPHSPPEHFWRKRGSTFSPRSW